MPPGLEERLGKFDGSAQRRLSWRLGRRFSPSRDHALDASALAPHLAAMVRQRIQAPFKPPGSLPNGPTARTRMFMLEISRRSFMAGCAASALLALSPALAFAQDAAVNVADLHAPGQLGEKVLGPAEAPVTVVEYASLSCPHCAEFHRTTFAEFRAKYVDTGKVRYIYRDFR
jgi:hypothetical protein